MSWKHVTIFVVIQSFFEIVYTENDSENDLKKQPDVKPGQYPFVVAVLNFNLEFICNGALVSVKHVLTAGDCFQPRVNKTTYCLAGDIFVDEYQVTPSRQISKIKTIIFATESPHEKHLLRKGHGFALALIEQPFCLSTNVSAIRIGGKDLAEGELVKIVGFGLPSSYDIESQQRVILQDENFTRKDEGCYFFQDHLKNYCYLGNSTIRNQRFGSIIINFNQPYYVHGITTGNKSNCHNCLLVSSVIKVRKRLVDGIHSSFIRNRGRASKLEAHGLPVKFLQEALIYLLAKTMKYILNNI